MIDMGHCMMNEDDEEEYEQFYDYARTYVNMGLKMNLAIEAPKEESKKRAVKDSGDQSDDSWEDVDMESDDEENEVIQEVDENEEMEEQKTQSQAATESFEIIDASQKSQTTESFTVVDKMNEDESSITAGSNTEDTPSVGSTFDMAKVKQGRKKTGMTRQEAFDALDIEKPELLSTGEVRLPSGKVLGHRRYKHIYAQGVRLPDERESIVIGKL